MRRRFSSSTGSRKIAPPDVAASNVCRADLLRIVEDVRPAAAVASIDVLPGGKTNLCYLVRRYAAEHDWVVRFATGDRRRFRSECRLLETGIPGVPLPRLVHVAPDARPFAFMIYQYVDGMTLRDFLRRASAADVHEAAFDVGRTLAAIARAPSNGALPFRTSPEIGPVDVRTFERYVLACAETAPFARRVSARDKNGLLALIDAWGSRLESLVSERTLVHGDFSRSNVLVRHDSRAWRVAAIIDWEFACGGSSLFDIGHMLRYEDPRAPLLEHALSAGFCSEGNRLPAEWRRLARVADIAAIAQGLTRAELPAGAETELVAFLRTTIDECAA